MMRLDRLAALVATVGPDRTSPVADAAAARWGLPPGTRFAGAATARWPR